MLKCGKAHTHTYTHTHTYMYIYIYIYIYTYIYINKHHDTALKFYYERERQGYIGSQVPWQKELSRSVGLIFIDF